MAFIDVREVTKEFATYNKIQNSIKNFFFPQKKIIQAVDNISFEIDEGESIAFIGANGAGKSTTIKMLSGVLTPTDGEIRVGGICPYQKRQEYVSRVGAVFGQRSQLWWDLPVSDSFDLLKEVYSVPQKQFNDNLKFFADILDIETYFFKPVRQLSLGQRMRCEVAAAFIHNPSIVFLDEPTIGLDVIAKENIRNFIKIINNERKVTVILTSHDMTDIETVCNRMIVIDKGRIVYKGNVNELGDIHGKKRILAIELSDVVEIDDQRIKILSDEGKKKNLEIELSNISIQQVVDILTRKAELIDMKISGIPIETIVKDIYSGKFGVK